MKNLDEAKTTGFFDKLLKNKGNNHILYYFVIFFIFNVFTFSCLICALNLYYAQKLLRKAKNCSKSQTFLKRRGKPMNCCCFLFLLFLYLKQ